MTLDSNQVKQDILNAIENDDLNLPTLPEVALQIREAANDPNVDISTLTKVIANDTALSARIVRVVNSPANRATGTISDLRTAVMRLGVNYTANLATSIAMQQMYQATSNLVDCYMREAWKHSTAIAGLSHVLCKHFTKLSPDQATLAGMVYRIGQLPILTYAEEHPVLLKDASRLNDIINEIHAEIGQRILIAWDFPTELVEVPNAQQQNNSATALTTNAGESTRARERSRDSYTDLVALAIFQNKLEHEPDNSLESIECEEINFCPEHLAVFERMGLEASAANEQIIDLHDDISHACEMLR